MTKKEKLEVFQDELGHLSEENLRKFAEQLLIDTDDWFYVDPASTSGKHHPSFSLGNGGLVRHTRAVVYWLWELYRSELFSLTGHQIELLTVAAIAHDIRKHDDSGKYVNNHAREAHNFVISEQVKHGTLISEDDAKYIANAISTHMGIWGTRDGERAPETNEEKILHLADLISSRREMSLDFLVDAAKHAPIVETKEAKMAKNVKPALADPGTFVINFGKHKGKTVNQLYAEDKGYVEWVGNSVQFYAAEAKNNIDAFLAKFKK